jgi:hypothetical protein
MRTPTNKGNVMPNLKNGLKITTQQWHKQKGKIAVIMTITTVLALKLNRHNIEAMREFAEEHGLLDEFMKHSIRIVKFEEDI